MAVRQDEEEVVAMVADIIRNTMNTVYPTWSSSNKQEQIKNDDQLIKFVTCYNVNTLIISLSNDKSNPKLLLSSNILESNHLNSHTVFLIKNESVILSKQNIDHTLSIIASTTNHEHITKLFKCSMDHLFIPYFKTTQNSIAHTLHEVSHNLQITANHSDDDHNLSKIKTIDDEIRYWKAKARSMSDAQSFYELLTPLKGRYNHTSKRNASNIDAETILNNVNELNDIFHLLWSDNYPHYRMRHLLYMIDDYIAHFISISLTKSVPSPFNVAFGDFQILIQKLMTIYSEWIDIRNNNLIKYFEQNTKRWKYDERECKINYIFKRLYDRMNDILMIRTLYQQTNALVSCASYFDTFETIQSVIWLCDDKHQSLFTKTKQIWDKKVHKSIKISAQKLEQRMKQISSQSPQLILAEFENFSILLQQSMLSKQFKTQKEEILSQMNHYFQSIQSEYEQLLTSNDDELFVENALFTTCSHSQSVLKIIACHRIKSRIEQLDEINHKLIQNEALKSNITDIKRDIHHLNQQIFSMWLEDQQQILQQSGLNDKNHNNKVMELDLVHDGDLIVHYSDHLVTLMNDCRLLKEFGYKMPTKVQKGYETASKFYKYAVRLKQIANFYNTMSSQIIQSQKGLLLNEAQQFEHIIKSKNALTWNKPKECDIFITKLMKASDALAHKNKRLRNLHHFIHNNIKLLMDLDLFLQSAKWDDIIHKIAAIFKQESKANSNKSMAIWIIYWDSQLFKLFLFQYKKSITKITNYLTNIECNLIFDRHRKLLKFRPSLKEIKHKLKSQTNKCIERPNNFKGFGLNSEIYAKILKQKEIKEIISNLDVNITAMIHELRATAQQYEAQWVHFGAIDFNKDIVPKLSNMSMYEEQFKFIQETAKHTEQIPDHTKVAPCFTISLIPFKNALDDMCHNFEDELIASLKSNIKHDIDALTHYISNGIAVLNEPPHNVAQLSKFKHACDDILAQKPKYHKLLNEIRTKNDILIKNLSSLIFQSQYTSAERKALDLTEIEQEWDVFEHSWLIFDDMLDEQRTNLQANVEKKIKDFKNEIDKLYSRWSALKPKTIDEQLNPSIAHQITQQIHEWREEHQIHTQSLEQLQEESAFFELNVDIALLDTMNAELCEYEASWTVFSQFVKEIECMQQELWISFRTRLLDFQDFYELWQKKIKKNEANRNNNTVFTYLKREIKQFEDIWPLLRCITGELFEKEHWNILFYKLSFAKSINLRNLTFGHLLRAKKQIIEHENALKNLASRAQGEVTIREAIQELQAWAENQEFDVTKMENKTHDICLIKGWKDLFVKIGDQLSLLSSLKESPYFESFRDRVSSLEERFIKLDELLRLLNTIQRKWVYLEPIFSKGALPKEQARFSRIDDSFIMIMKAIEANQNVMNLLVIHNIQQTLSMLVDQLERCQKALSDYLEDKRSKFPRFYFLGDDDMLQILGQSMNPKVIQTHLKKLYQGIYRVTFSKDEQSIIAVQSANHETVTLSSPVSVSSQVEVWLNNLTKEMKSTLKQHLFACMKQFNVQKYPSQILCLCQSVQFTASVEEYISNSSKLSKYHQELQAKLEKYTTSNTANDILSELKIKSLILDLIHYIQVIEVLLEHRVNSVNDWLWLKQLRFYINESTQYVTLQMVNAEFSYSFEYQGNATKLVHTPLTDKCYLVLTQGMHLGFGGNPYGPAGTGKTESVKALAHYMGRQVLVFNCDEAIDFKSMGRIFTGLVQCGAWGCFDEFNRLKEDQLSAVSQQIQIIQSGLRHKHPQIHLLNKTINLHPNSGIFVTMNPASKEYGGRSKLPDNLKQLFRSVAMTKPDSELIAQVLLYAEGFKCAKKWGHKLTELYILSKQLLSPQKHYDWGLRALKSVLNSSGNALREAKQSGLNMTEQLEMSLLLKSLRINTLSKLTFRDSEIFANLVHDVFADKDLKDEAGNEGSFQYKLEAQITIELKKLDLELVNNQMKKIVQLHEALSQRMGVVIVGPSQCGKSTLYRILHESLISLGQSIEIYVMNPKAVDREQLLGYMDMDTREWFDGILTRAARNSISNSSDNITTWIICDGDIDPEWIESLNSVLDDNHLLSLPNGERIQFGNNVNFIFETHDLSFASPATISRMGMIYLSQQDIQLKTLIHSWIVKHCGGNEKNMIESWMNDIFMKTVHWIDKNIINNPQISSKLSFVVPTTIIGMVSNALSQLIGATNNKKDFLVRCMYGLTSDFPIKIADKIALKLAQLSNIKLQSENPSLVYLDHKNDTIAPFINHTNIDSDIWKTETFSLKALPIIKTRNICKNLKIMEQWLHHKHSFILVGSEGCGKSKLIHEAFKLYIEQKAKHNKNVSIASVHCNAYTKSHHIIHKLHQNCSSFSSNNGKVLRPNNGCDSLILYLKDINLPQPDHYNTSQLIELLQQFITYKGFYDENLDFVHLENIQFVFSMNHCNTLGTHALSARFTAGVGITVLPEPTKDELSIIYRGYCSIVSSISQLNTQQMQALQSISSAMIDIYHEIKAVFNRDELRHFIPTLRDLTEWCFGLIRYPLDSVGVITAWYHEGMRIFYDRMPNEATKQKLTNIMQCTINKYKLSLTEVKERSVYCTFVNDIAHDSDDLKQADEMQKVRQEIGLQFSCVSVDDFRTVIASKIRSYEKEFNELHLILFEEFLHNLAKLDRIISHGYFHNMVMIGNSGIGRKIIAKLLCYIHHIECRILKISQEYQGTNQFANTLKDILRSTGIDGNKILLYIEDCQLIDDAMLEYLNCLVSTRDVIGLFDEKELDALLTPIKEEYKQNGINQYKSIYDYFISRVCTNLYITLSMDPHNKNFVAICENNPNLMTNCNVIWMGNQWKNDSMKQYAQSQIQSILKHCSTEQEAQHLLQQIQSLHHANIEYGACPRSLMTLITVYNSIFDKKLAHNQQLHGHLLSGLKKLNEAEEIVDDLSIEAAKQREQLKQKQTEADAALNQITESMSKANTRRDDAERLKIKLAEKEVILNGRKKHIEIELHDIQPLLDEAKAAVGQIRRDSLNELRMLRLPPEAINDVLSGVLILMGNFDTSWHSMKSFLAKPSIKQEIMNYDARRITPQIRKKANQLLQDKADSFEAKRIQRVSVAAAPLAAWFKANITYSVVLEKIAPLERELSAAQNDIHDAKDNMNKVENELIELDQQVANLKVNFTKITSEAEALKISLKKAQDTLDRAQTLLKKLLDEKHRWDQQVNDIETVTVLLPKYCLILANFITYLGGYPENLRVACMQKWTQIVLDNNDDDIDFDVLRFMHNESDLLQWKAEALPDDVLSYENAMIILNAELYPFIIDPNGDATNWLTNHLKVDNISHEIIQQSDARFMKQLQLSVRFGKTIIVKDIDNIAPCLYPLLRRTVSKQGARQVISVGDKWVDFNPQFQLYLITRNSNFCVPSRCKPLLTQLNFSVTKSGLESQLLAITLKYEQPELERKKSKLLQDEERYKMQLADLEKELLQQLAMSSGNILDNMSLIESLNNTKIQSENIKKALQESNVIQNDLNEQREIYRLLAVIGSNAYFTIKSLQSLNHMYQFSLSSFLMLFESNLNNISKNKNIKQHIKNLEEHLICKVYRYISRSLFKCDRLSFALHFVYSLNKNICKQNEWEYFIGEIIHSANKNNNNNKEIPTWINSEIKQSFQDLCINFPDIALKCEFNKYSNEWLHWLRSNSPETTLKSNILSKLSSNITDFEQLLLIKTFRTDRLLMFIDQFISKYLHLKSSSSSNNISLKELYEHETCNKISILFVTTPGADPSNELRELAINKVGEDKYHEMAMSSGQQYDAINLIKIAAENGDWICLKNLHLVIPWIKILQQLLSSLNPSKDFRLWLTTESHPQFPSILLQHSLKITCEPPPGVKQNLNRTFSLWTDSYIALHNNPIRAQLLFMLSWFHAIIQERRTFIPCGWNKYYEFNEADLRASVDIIDSIFIKHKNITNVTQLPWKLLWGLLSQAIYGGRIDNEIDLNTINSYLHSYFNSNIISMHNNNNTNKVNVAGSKWLCLIPKTIRKYEYMKLIQSMSNTDTPDIFGLPLNANNIVSLQKTNQLLQSLKVLSVINVITSIDTLSKIRNSQRKRINPLIILWKNINNNNDKPNMKEINENNPIATVVSLEIHKLYLMIRYIDKSITKIEKGLFGKSSFSNDLMSDINELIAGFVPWSWNKLWNKGNGPSNPKLFLLELIKRKEILQKWRTQLQNKSFLKSNIVIAHCFYPITFLNAFKQFTSHELQTTIDKLSVKCVWDKNATQINNEMPVLNIDGLYIQGALFDGKNLKHVSSKNNALSKAPVCYLYYENDRKMNDNKGCIKVPVYYSLDRSYKVFDVMLNVKDSMKWNLSGIAFIMTNVY